MYKILFVNLPFSGHVNPTLGLARELVKRGHKVDYILSEPWRECVERTGATFIPYDNYPQKKLSVVYESFICYKAAFKTAINQRETYDLLIYENWFFLGAVLAESMKLPCIKLFSNPAFNETYIRKEILDKSSILFHMRYKAIRKLISRITSAGVPNKYGDMFVEMAKTPAEMNLVYTIRDLQPHENEFDHHFHFIGPSIRKVFDTSKFSFPETLGKVIYLSFGTIIKNKAFIKKCIQAFANTEYTLIVSIGLKMQINDFGNLPDNIYLYQYVPQCYVLSKVDLFISHGGQNSINEAMYYGVPLVILPQGFDCKSNADQLEKVQVARKISKNIDKKELFYICQDMINDKKLKQNCVRISKKMQLLDADIVGAECVCSFLEGDYKLED